MSAAPFLLAAAAAPAVRRLLANGFDFDLIDAHYLYPDGVAATLLGRWFRKPVLMTARGSDVNILPRYALPRRMILAATRSAHAIVTVAEALKRSLVQLGVQDDKISVLRNGVDLLNFWPEDRATSRRDLDVAGYCVACVGNLVPLKGVDLVIEAIAGIDDATLLIAGGGPLLEVLRARAIALGISSRVRFLGRLPQSRLRTLYSAADALVLASSSEGWANVLLESMACGTPVIATAVGGSPEIVASPQAGLLLSERSAAAIVRALTHLRAAPPDRAAVRRYAEQFSWEATTKGQLSLFRRAMGATAAGA
ncbi:MAG: glycosyltransferase [Burkholderiales bacterium]